MAQDLLSSRILSLVIFGYLGAWILYLGLIITKKQIIGRLASGLMGLAALAHLAAFFLRWWETYRYGAGHAPLTNMFESLSFFALSLALLYCITEFKLKERRFGVLIAPAAWIILNYAGYSNQDILPLMPALKSNWLISHVLTCFLAYAAFTGAFFLGLAQLFWPFKNKEQTLGDLPIRLALGQLTYQALVFGFVMLSAGIITGAVWAERAWGSYWSWDPKETFSLITWLIYALAIHLKVMRGWSDKKMALLTTIGFGAVLFTYLGVNKLLPGLHSYANF